jgi:hypothetical protein
MQKPTMEKPAIGGYAVIEYSVEIKLLDGAVSS